MNAIYILLVILALFVTGCIDTQTAIEAEIQEEVETEDLVPEEVLDTVEDMGVEVVPDQEIYVDENISISVEDGVYVTKVDSVEDFESAPFSEWCIPGDVYGVESEEADVESIIIGVTEYKGNAVCEAEHTMTQEYVGEIQTTYYISEDSKQIWVLSTMMGQTTESYVDMR